MRDRATELPAASNPAWSVDVLLGLRLIRAGGRGTAVRMALTAFGIAMSVLVIITLAAVFEAGAGRDSRLFAATPNEIAPDPPGSVARTMFRWQAAVVYSGDQDIEGLDLSAIAAHPAPPPGLDHFPRPGEVAVSPALRTMWEHDPSLRQRIGGSLVTTLDPSALVASQQLLFYRGVSAAQLISARSAAGWGGPAPNSLTDTTRELLFAGGAILLVPLVFFLALAGRIGGTARDRRSAAIRLLGADIRQLRRLTAIEVSIAGVIGATVGIAVFYLLRPLAHVVTFGGYPLSASELRPPAVLLLIMVIGAPAIAISAGVLGSRRNSHTPLGVVRKLRPRPRFLWRAVVVLLILICALHPVVPYAIARLFPTPLVYASVRPLSSVLLVLIVPLLLPSLVDLLGRTGRNGSPAARLALGRISQDSVGAARTTAGLSVVLAGAMALTAVLAADSLQPEMNYSYANIDRISPAQFSAISAGLARTPGVDIARLSGLADESGAGTAVQLMDCRSITEDRGWPCQDGDAFVLLNGRSPAPAPGTSLSLPGGNVWLVPPNVHVVTPTESDGTPYDLVFLTPEAAVDQLTGDGRTIQVSIQATIAPQQLQAARDAVSVSGAQVADESNFGLSVAQRRHQSYTDALARSGLTIGLLLTLAVCILGQLVTAIERITDNRRSLVMTRAAGLPMAVVARSYLIEAAIPAILGTMLAVPAGFLLTQLLGQPRSTLDVGAVAVWMAPAAVAIVLLFSLLTIPLVRRTARIEGLRTP